MNGRPVEGFDFGYCSACGAPAERGWDSGTWWHLHGGDAAECPRADRNGEQAYFRLRWAARSPRDRQIKKPGRNR